MWNLTLPATCALAAWWGSGLAVHFLARSARGGLQCRSAAGLALLDAGAGGGEHLGGAAAILWVEGGAQPEHGVQVLGGEQPRHEVGLLDADAVLAGDAAAASQAFFQDLVPGGEDALHLVRIAL